MWTCPVCNRVFQKAKQPHSCRKTPLEQHFRNKDTARELFDDLTGKINSQVGKFRIVSLPCCVHLFGTYDFVAALPKKDGLEIRLGLDRVLESRRLKQSVPLSHKYYKNCIDIKSKEEIDEELIGWIDESYHLKD
jgi:Domain of unknown function (DUF5655)